MRSNKRCANVAQIASAAWCITATGVRSICRCGTPTGSPTPEIAPSVGSRGDSYDNALAELVIGLLKTEVIRRQGPWPHLARMEFATLAWVAWFNNRRLLEPIGYVPPAEFDAHYYEQVKVA